MGQTTSTSLKALALSLLAPRKSVPTRTDALPTRGTPAGPGLLLSTYAAQCEILLDDAAKTIRVRTEDVTPIQ
jgi:hypothetical protein